jgi:hypothetical protein
MSTLQTADLFSYERWFIQGIIDLAMIPSFWWTLGAMLLGFTLIKIWELVDPCTFHPTRSTIIWLLEGLLSMELECTIWRSARG